MRYKIEFELPDNDTVLKEIKHASVGWKIWGYSGIAKPVPSVDAVQYTNDEIQRMQDIEQAQIEKAHDIGYEEGKADAVPVVRCKDCKHRPTETGANHDLEFPDCRCPCQCEDDYYSWMPKDNWFCANWERRTDG